jgi:hypothetical protein
MPRDPAEILAEISAVRSLIRRDLDAASLRVSRRMRLAAAGAAVGAIVGVVLLRARVAPLMRGGLAAAVIGYRLARTLGALIQWLDANRPPRIRRRPAGERNGAIASRQLVIVAATDVPLYDSLRAAFDKREGIEIMLDRRRQPTALRRPPSDRRTRPDIEAQIQSTGWARLVLPSGPGDSGRDPRAAGAAGRWN